MQRYAAIHEHTVIATVADTDESGSVSPADRPGLGPWLTDPARLARYDTLIATDLDRLGRSACDLTWLRDWAVGNGKRIIVLGPPLQWPPEPGAPAPVIWDILERIAENEVQVIAKRSRQKMLVRENGAVVGKPPFGSRGVPDNGQIRLEPDPAAVAVVKDAIHRYLDGWSIIRICEWLDGQGVHRHSVLDPREYAKDTP